MDDKKKILLGEKDIIARDNEDIFINLNLSKTFSEIRKEKYENVFDISNQYNKERNESRGFRIYGTIDSTVVDSNNLILDIFSSQTSAPIFQIKSTSLVYDEVNAYGKKRGKYILQLDNYNEDFVYIKILSDNLNYLDQTYIQQLIFKDADKNFVEYGTNTIDIDENGNTIGIDNDFYFFYDKHWIKKDLSIERTRTPKVSFSSKTNPDTILEGGSNFSTFAVSIDQPSIFGFEKVDLLIDSNTLTNNSTEINLSDENFVPYPQPPFTLSFAQGEQNKIINFQSLGDTAVEPIENVAFELGNLQKVLPGSATTHIIYVSDTTPVPPPPPQSIRAVTFEIGSFFMGKNQEVSIKIFLNNNAIGNESIQIDVVNANTTANSGDYALTPSAPIQISWAPGENNKFIKLKNTFNGSFFKVLQLQLSNLNNLVGGTYTTSNIFLS